MLTGHFAAGLALKQYDKSIPLWVLFIGTQFVDIAFMLLLLTDIEHLRITPDFNAFNDLDLYHYPFTHGLLATPLWIAGFIGLYAIWNKIDRTIVCIFALAISSHWLFDLFTHTPDLPLVGDSFKVGFGLWNYPFLSIALEVLFICFGSWLYLRNNTPNSQKKITGVFVLGVLLIIPPAIGPLLPTPQSVQEVAISGLIMYAFFTAIAFNIDRLK